MNLGARDIAFAQAGRFRPAGIGILVAGALLLYVGLQFVRGGEHPLAATIGFDLCARLGPQPATELTELRADPQAKIPEFSATRGSTCHWLIDDARSISIVMSTHQSLRAEGNGRGTRQYVETFLAESRASGSNVATINGPWKIGATIGQRAGNELQLLAEDDGVALWFLARGIDPDALIAFAGAAARRLRERS